MPTKKLCLLFPTDVHENIHTEQILYTTTHNPFPVRSDHSDEYNELDDQQTKTTNAQSPTHVNCDAVTHSSPEPTTSTSLNHYNSEDEEQAASIARFAHQTSDFTPRKRRPHLVKPTTTNDSNKRNRPWRLRTPDNTALPVDVLAQPEHDNAPRRRGKQRLDRPSRELFYFFSKWRHQEYKSGLPPRELAATVQTTTTVTTRVHYPAPHHEKLAREFLDLTAAQKYYYTHMFELWSLFERQQIPLVAPVTTATELKERTKTLFLAFFFLNVQAQKKLVDDWLVERTARQRERHAEMLEACLARRVLSRIKTNLLSIVTNIDYVLEHNIEPQTWRFLFTGI